LPFSVGVSSKSTQRKNFWQSAKLAKKPEAVHFGGFDAGGGHGVPDGGGVTPCCGGCDEDMGCEPGWDGGGVTPCCGGCDRGGVTPCCGGCDGGGVTPCCGGCDEGGVTPCCGGCDGDMGCGPGWDGCSGWLGCSGCPNGL